MTPFSPVSRLVSRSWPSAPGAWPRVQEPHMREVVIVEAVRTPIGRGHPEKGIYKDTHPNELLGACFLELIARTGIEAEAVEHVIAGCVQQFGEQSLNTGRNAWL